VEEPSNHFRGGRSFSTLLEQARELRARQTPAEELLWQLLRNRQLHGAKFRRQHQFGSFILDFYCHEAHLAIECDGAPHPGRDSVPTIETVMRTASGRHHRAAVLERGGAERD
jgi:very-short-patch-repair endonuclease